MAFDAA